MHKSGRPAKSEINNNSREELINAAARIISREGTNNLTIRNICQEANLSIGTFYHFFTDKNDLIMTFITEPSFSDIKLLSPLNNISQRITELYNFLIQRYIKFGREFVKSFYNPCNKILSAYMGEHENKFLSGSIMERSEQELNNALAENIIKLPENISIHEIASDICTIVKGCVFEWCLCDDDINIYSLTERIIANYMSKYV